jgi:Ca-activated chloride channel family protein
MTFIWPSMLFLLALVPLLVVIYIQMQQRRRRMSATFGSSGFVQGAAARKLGLRRQIPAVLFLVALMILIVALARPQTVVGLPRVEGTIILAFDVSGSMAADDLKPTRMEAAKTAARAFVERQPSSVQIGVVSFSNAGFTTQPPTDDQAAILAAINRLTVQSGTSLAQGITASLTLISAVTDPPLSLSNRDQTATPTPVPDGSYKPAVIVLLTDGENNLLPDPLEVAQTAEDRGVRIHTVGIGSTEGATLNIDGFSIRSRLDEETLQQIAQLTGGNYYNAENEEELRTVYDSINPQLIIKPQKIEVTSLFAGAGLLVLMIGGTFSLLWLSRLP